MKPVLNSRSFDPQEVKTLAQLSAHYAVVDDENPAGMFARFNLSGCDYKGQISSGFGTRGFSFEVKAGFDPGSAFGFTLEAMAGGKASRTYVTMMVCCRMPTAIYGQVLTASMLPRVPVRTTGGPAASRAASKSPLPAVANPKPAWRGSQPLTLAVLTGVAWQGQLRANATAAMGKVDLGEIDEVGYRGEASGVAAEVSVDGAVRALELVDKSPRSFGGSPMDGGLALAVESELVGDIKVQVLAWLKELKQESASSDLLDRKKVAEGMKYFRLSDDADGDGDGDGEGGEGDREDEPDDGTKSAGDAEGAEGREDQVSKELFPDLPVEEAKKVWKLASVFNRRQSTVKLLNRLQKVQMELEGDDEHSRQIQQKVAEFSARLLALKSRKDKAKQAKQDKKDKLLVPNKAYFSDDAEPAVPLRQALVPARFALRSARLKADASAKGSFDGSLLGRKLKVDAKADFNYVGKRVRTLFQAVGEGTGDRTLVMSQESLLTHSVFSAQVGGAVNKKKGTLVDKVYGTITYRSVTVYWLAGDEPTPHALPNGSGLSFGLSIAADRLALYADWCRTSRASSTVADDAVQKTERYLSEQLRVDQDVLRPFFADYHFDPGELEPAVLVEAAFAFEPTAEDPALPELKMSLVDKHPLDLFKYPPACARLGASTADAVPGSALQALRVRCPLGAETDEGRSIFALGVVFLKTKVQRVARVGSHGAFDLHARFYPDPFADEKDAATAAVRHANSAKQQQELAVPPVALFGEIE